MSLTVSCERGFSQVNGTYHKKKLWNVNVVPAYEKLLELVVKDQLLKYCDDNAIIVDEQSGFRSV